MILTCKFFMWSRRNDPNPNRDYRADIDRFYLVTPEGRVYAAKNLRAERWWSIREVPGNADYIGEGLMPWGVLRYWGN